jgi:diguanylate cyclase (GGDEF)-like protein
MRALIADDDPTTTAILQAAMTRWNIDVTVVHDGHAAWQQLQAVKPPPLAILDWMMPGLDGIELCRRMRATPRTTSIYTILLTGRSARQDLVAGLDAGADDYMVKPVDLEELRARVHVGRRVATLQHSLAERVDELQRTRDRLAQMVNTDVLTEVHSRRGWFDRAETEFARFRRYGRGSSLLAVDLDYFKRVNDGYGHEAGDAVLKQFAALLRAECRASDIIGRIGGEEFVVVLPETSPADAENVAARLTAACRRQVFETPAGVVRISCSSGLTEFRNEDKSAEDALRRADAALYRAKRDGRDRWTHAA